MSNWFGFGILIMLLLILVSMNGLATMLARSQDRLTSIDRALNVICVNTTLPEFRSLYTWCDTDDTAHNWGKNL